MDPSLVKYFDEIIKEEKKLNKSIVRMKRISMY